MLRCVAFPVLSAAIVAAAFTPTSIAGAQSGVTLSPFVTFLPTGSSSPMAGLSIAVTGGPLALRGGAHLSLQEKSATATSDVTMRPWGADADALAYLNSYSYGDRVAFTPYVFTGVSQMAIDSSVYRITRQGWSYGAGLTLPVGSALGMFGEARWRMSKFVMPDANNAPPTTREFRFGLSFRVGGGGSAADVMKALGAATESGLIWDAATTASTGGVGRLLTAAESFIGTPYRRGGTSPSGFDASGFVRFIFSRFGVNLPRASRDQARVGERLSKDLRVLEPGDLLLFEDDGGINHVAIYVGHARIIHSSETGGGVRYDDLTTERGRWFMQHFATARRIQPDDHGGFIDLSRGYPSDIPNGADGPDHAPRAPLRKRN